MEKQNGSYGVKNLCLKNNLYNFLKGKLNEEKNYQNIYYRFEILVEILYADS